MIKHNSPKGTVEVLEGRNVLKSAGWGEWGPEDVKELIQALIKLSGHLKPGKWGYMADPSQMDPILSSAICHSLKPPARVIRRLLPPCHSWLSEK